MYGYLELPLIVGYGQPDTKIVKLKILPGNITAYHEGYEENLATYIYIGEQPFQIALTIDQYENIIQKYWEVMNRKQSIKNLTHVK